MTSDCDQHHYVALPHLEVNREAKQTILLIHGATGDGTTWDLVTPHLPGYHLLVPDLPGHGIARQHPFSVVHASNLLSQLILDRAHNRVAYVVGFSLGAHVAMHLRIEYAIPRSWTRWAMDGINIPRPDLSMCTLDYNRQVFGHSDSTEQWPRAWPARTLVIAAGKGGLVPSNDRPQDALKLATIGQHLNSATRAVTHPDMRHPWIWQAPELFAETVRLWFEESTVPDGFVSLARDH
ncbi:alpha/beta-hydrolase [Aureobasidium pullulans]|nr:alpha/beta-hydrolase [Aureobasidium pullulans]